MASNEALSLTRLPARLRRGGTRSREPGGSRPGGKRGVWGLHFIGCFLGISKARDGSYEPEGSTVEDG